MKATLLIFILVFFRTFVNAQFSGGYVLAPQGVTSVPIPVTGTIAEAIDFGLLSKTPTVHILVVMLIPEDPNGRVVKFTTRRIEDEEKIKSADRFIIFQPSDKPGYIIVGTLNEKEIFYHHLLQVPNR